MKKNIIKFIIIFSLIFSISNSNVFAQFSKKISGEQLEKLLTENYILINGRFGSFKWEFNKDKTYYVTPRHDKTFQMPNNGTWEITGIFGSSLILTDRQQIINGRNIKYQFFFGEDGYIYTGSERMHSYGLENIQEKINKEARLVEEKRVAEELRLKKIEEEKKQLAIKREQERIKQEEEKKRLQVEYELTVKRDKERREEQERKELYANIVKYSLLSLFLLIISLLTYKYKSKINNFYLKFINLIQELKNNMAKENKLTPNYKKIKSSSNNNFNLFKSILNKKGPPEEKYFYLLPAMLSIFYIINMHILHPIFRNVFFFHYLKLGSAFVFIFNSIFIFFKNYSTSKKLNFTSFLLFIIISFWGYGLLVGWERGSTKFWTILIFQTYLFLNLYLDKQFNILNIGAVSSLLNFNFFKNKKIVSVSVLIILFISYFSLSNNTMDKILVFKEKNELEVCKDVYRWLQKKIDDIESKTHPADYRYTDYYMIKVYQKTVEDYYQMALKSREGYYMNKMQPSSSHVQNFINNCEFNRRTK